MNKFEQYIERYKRLHNGTDNYVAAETSKNINPDVLASKIGKIIFDGSQLGKKMPQFIQHVIDTKKRAVSLLDYGCGKAVHNYVRLSEHGGETLIARFKGMIQCYYCYDPAVEIYNIKPSPGSLFDLVCCSDVMEHVPEEYVDYVLEEISSYTKHDGTAIFTISGNLAAKLFPDGENLHVTIKPLEYWVAKLKEKFVDKSFLLIYNDSNDPSTPLKIRYQNSSNLNIWDYKDKQVTVRNNVCESEEV